MPVGARLTETVGCESSDCRVQPLLGCDGDGYDQIVSCTAHIILIVDKTEDRNAEQLAMWVNSDQAADLGGRELLEANTGPGEPNAQAVSPVEAPGELIPIALAGSFRDP